MGLLEIGLSNGFAVKTSSHIKFGRISSSYVIVGTQDRLPLEFAKSFAKALNCLKMPGDFCDSCQNCNMINAGTHPDFSIYTSETSRFGIGLVRKIQENSYQSNYSARFRVNILANADTMTVEAQNALLKMLEEGRKGCTNLLLAASTDTLLPTILSRSILLKIPPLSIEKTTEILEQSGLTHAQSESETEASAGEIRTSIWVMKNPQLAEKIAQIMTKPGQTDPLSVLDALNDETQLDEIVRFMNELLHRAGLELSGIRQTSPVFGDSTGKLALMGAGRIEKLRKTVDEIERLWKTQIRKQQLLQTKLLSQLT